MWLLRALGTSVKKLVLAVCIYRILPASYRCCCEPNSISESSDSKNVSSGGKRLAAKMSDFADHALSLRLERAIQTLDVESLLQSIVEVMDRSIRHNMSILEQSQSDIEVASNMKTFIEQALTVSSQTNAPYEAPSSVTRVPFNQSQDDEDDLKPTIDVGPINTALA